MHSLDHEIVIDADPGTVYAALSTPEGVRGWFTPTARGNGETGTAWDMEFPGTTTSFRWEIEATQPDVLVAWRCLDGPGDAPGTTVVFRIEQTDETTSRLHFSHRGWPHTAGAFTRCNTLWGGLLHHLRTYAESGAPAPMYT